MAASYALLLAAALVAAPPFPSRDPSAWIGPPQDWAALRGKVVLLEVWTFGCVNCTRTIPWVKDVHAKYSPRGVVVVGIHSPEFGFEKKPEAVQEEIRRHGLAYTNYLDVDRAYWKALETQAWPTTYFVDKCGRIRDTHVGEIHSGQETGKAAEATLETLLAENPSCDAGAD
jgi:hypothetical protein